MKYVQTWNDTASCRKSGDADNIGHCCTTLIIKKSICSFSLQAFRSLCIGAIFIFLQSIAMDGKILLIKKKVAYKPPTEYLFLDQKRKMKLVARIKKSITKFELKPEDVGFVIA